ncbi:hypothetical protein B0H19DRAFT_697702 [Mycena capillaripes]|nr:hypothetical protein B0H19DRAFT_697702 [Mycena capillaripes]
MADTADRTYQPYPWPFGQPSILAPVEHPTKTWLDVDFAEDDSSDDYIPSEGSASDGSTSDSDEQTSDSALEHDSASEDHISDSEVVDVHADAQTGWWSSPTPSQKAFDDQEELTRQIAELVKAEQDAAAAYNPDEVISLITQFYELLITMGHWPEGSLSYPPHTDPPVNVELAVQLEYTPAVIALMQRLPYVSPQYNDGDEKYAIVSRTRFADYTRDEDLREGRHPYPYQYLDGCPEIDPWLLPLMLPNRDGWHVMLDTNLGVVRAYCTERFPPQDTVEWRRHGEVSDAGRDQATWTEYRRAPLVPAVRYFSDLIYAYTSLSRLPIMSPDRNDPKEDRYRWLTEQEREMWSTLLTLYRECGWPNEWQRAEFLTKWEAKEKELAARARTMQGHSESTSKRRQT